MDPPSTLEPLPLPPGAGGLSAAAADGQAGALGLGSSMMLYGGGAATSSSSSSPAADDAGANEDALPLTRAQLQAKVVKNLDSILERNLKVKAHAGGGSALGGRRRG